MTTKVAERATPKRRGRPVKKVSTVLINAKAILEDHGMTKGCLLNKRGRVCIEGALALACGADPAKLLRRGTVGAYAFPSHREFGLFVAAYRPLADVCERAPQMFNDTKETTRKKVLAKFDEAIVLAKRAERRQPAVKVSA